MSLPRFPHPTVLCAVALFACSPADNSGPEQGTGQPDPSTTTTGTGSTTDTGDDTTPPTDTGTPPFLGTCPTTEQRQLVGAYLIDVVDRVPRLAESAMDIEPMTFILLPGWDPVGIGFPILWIPCMGPAMLSETCDGVSCTTTECVAPGSSWIQHARLETAPMTDPAGVLTYHATHGHVSWSDQAPGDLEVELDAIAYDDAGTNYTMSVEATYLWGELSVVITFPDLLGTGEVVTAIAYESWGAIGGGVAVDGVLVAELIDDASGFRIEETGACP